MRETHASTAGESEQVSDGADGDQQQDGAFTPSQDRREDVEQGGVEGDDDGELEQGAAWSANWEGRGERGNWEDVEQGGVEGDDDGELEQGAAW